MLLFTMEPDHLPLGVEEIIIPRVIIGWDWDYF